MEIIEVCRVYDEGTQSVCGMVLYSWKWRIPIRVFNVLLAWGIKRIAKSSEYMNASRSNSS